MTFSVGKLTFSVRSEKKGTAQMRCPEMQQIDFAEAHTSLSARASKAGRSLSFRAPLMVTT